MKKNTLALRPCFFVFGGLLTLLLTTHATYAQVPTISSLSPTRNLRNAARSSNVAVTFSTAMQNTAATQQAVRVFSQQRGGLMFGSTRGVASVSGSTVTFDPTTDFRPGETVYTTVTTAATSSGGQALAAGRVHQFTTATGGTGSGNFVAPATNPTAAVGANPVSVAVGDVDGDGDLDLLAANLIANTVSVRLNDGTGSFTAPATNPNPAVGDTPQSVVLGDVDGDGDLDLLTANYSSSSVSVRLNDGTGNFTAPATNPDPSVGGGPYSVAVGDVDGDGDLDLLVANYLTIGTVSVRLNDGTGNFTAPAINPNPSVASLPISVAVGDVDGDGDLDFLTANTNSFSVSVRLNDGSGNFTEPAINPEPSVSNVPQSVVLGDVDGDGDLDFLTANRDANTVSVRLNNGTGNFTDPAINPNPAVGDGPNRLAVSDVDGDGDLDLLTVNLGGTVSVRLNDGTGNFTAPAANPNLAVGTQPSSLAMGDVDGDGDLDLLTTNNIASGTVGVRLNQPPPITISSLSPTRNARSAARSSNVAVTFSATMQNTAATQQAVRVFSQQRGGRMFGSTRGTASVSGSTVTFDPTNDFRPGETVFATVTTAATSSGGQALAAGRVHQFTTATGGTGIGNFTAPATNPNSTVGSVPYSVAVGDVDGDGDLDLLAANLTASTVSVRLNDGTGNFTAPATNPNPAVGTNPYSVVLGDVDGDGDLDLLTANGGSNTVSVRLNDGTGNFTAPATNPNPAVGLFPYSVAVGDVDGDGDLDLLTASFGSGNTVSVRLNDGTGNFTAPATNPNPSVGTNPRSVAVGDVDGDGDLDLLTANQSANTVSVRLNDGTGNFTAPATNPNPAVGTAPYSVAVGDVDGDGDLDLLTANNTAATVSVRLNDGTGNFTAPATNPETAVGVTPTSVVLGDVDGDGDLDLLAANNTASTVSVRLNDGTGNFTAPATNPDVSLSSFLQSVALGDVDGDGDLDLLTANSGSNTVSVRLNQPPVPAITSFTPTTGPVGTVISLTGTNLTGATAITFSGISGNVVTTGFTVVNGTSITGIVVPAGALTGPLTVTTPAGTSAASVGSFTMEFYTVTALNPVRNARTAALTTPVAVTFSAPLNAATAGNIRVFSQQYRGRRTATASTSGATATLTPTVPATGAQVAGFKPGETLFVTVPATVQSTSGVAASRQVYQFTAAASGTGVGNFLAPAPNPNPAVGTTPFSVAVGDVDSDGDLDLLTANFGSNTVSVRLNDGTGNFTAPATNPNPTVGSRPYSVAVGDVDGDGDLDLLTANSSSNTVSVRLNDGTGNFTAPATTPNPAVGTQPYSVALGDVDGDGDLDMLTANRGSNRVSVRLNDGSGIFTGSTEVPVGTSTLPVSVAVGDVDGDGDLDLLTANNGTGTVSVRLNDGAGNFSGGSNPAVGSSPQSVALGDVDGDGDPDLLTANNGGTVSVRLNDGAGNFSGGSNPAVGSNPQSVTVGDVDGDGDLDLLAANRSSATVSVLVNDGTGSFTAPATNANPAVGTQPYSVALGDVDGDGDLDLLAANQFAGTVSVRLNQPPVPAISSLGPIAELPGQAVTLTGTGFVAGSTVTFGGVAASSVTVNSSTSLTAVVPAGATPGSSTVVVTTTGGSSTGSPAFEVLQVYRNTAASGCLSTDPVTLTGSGGTGAWRYLRLPGPGGAVVAAIEDTQNLGSVTASLSALGTATSTTVRADGRANRRYLDRNFALAATNPSFTGQTVRVRFFGLNSELARLTAADANATLGSLNASQYDGANVNCDLADNDPAGQRRLLPAPATVAAGADWFTAQLTVADHFSEFYLTGSSAPLPVELVSFTAQAQGRAMALAWRTASEKNSARFDVERGTDGQRFEKIGQIAAQGTKTSPTDYAFLDESFVTSAPQQPLTYYRLRQVDADSSASYSPVRVVAAGRIPVQQFTLAPNPARTSVTVAGAAPGTVLTVYDALGRVVATALTNAAGTARLVLPPGLAAGVYVVRSGTQARRLLVE